MRAQLRSKLISVTCESSVHIVCGNKTCAKDAHLRHLPCFKRKDANVRHPSAKC
jgi:hypothetical protein